MNKVYMFIYAMVIFFTIFISITNCGNEDCGDHKCIPPKVPLCMPFPFPDNHIGQCECGITSAQWPLKPLNV
ncbi:unnamed protein product [Trifolium pratense]|uniref:Uncharacterized protein n=1 Tax=Trifolium pratense TaxID=57577 RepID=A0ACB0M0Z6_TRIPR|nr:unnamed protein product [Trifolium pratense]